MSSLWEGAKSFLLLGSFVTALGVPTSGCSMSLDSGGIDLVDSPARKDSGSGGTASDNVDDSNGTDSDSGSGSDGDAGMTSEVADMKPTVRGAEDTDGDGVPDSADACPRGRATGSDTDGDGCTDAEDPDDDGDHVGDADELRIGTDPQSAESTPNIVRVSARSSAKSPDGRSWASAFRSLQDGLSAAAALLEAFPGPTEVWVAAGTYYPDDGVLQTPGDIHASFELRDGIALYGGFEGSGELLLSERDWSRQETVLSGDLGRDDSDETTTLTLSGNDVVGTNANNVVIAHAVGATAVLNGFTITGGDARLVENGNSRGGGLFSFPGSPTLTNLRFIGNRAIKGGGAYVESASLSNVVFERNVIHKGGGGGGLYCAFSGSELSSIRFEENSTDLGENSNGGAMVVEGGDVAVTDAHFYGNSSTSAGAVLAYSGAQALFVDSEFVNNEAVIKTGGAIRLSEGTLTLRSVVLAGNSSGWGGGGIYVQTVSPEMSASLNLNNVAMGGNYADGRGGGLMLAATEGRIDALLTNVTMAGCRSASVGGAISADTANVTIYNSIIWNNSSSGGGIADDNWSGADENQVFTSLIQNTTTTLHGNLNASVVVPAIIAYVNPAMAPNPLLTDLRVRGDSATVDAGSGGAPTVLGSTEVIEDVATDVAGNPRVVGDSIDIGAYEAQN